MRGRQLGVHQAWGSGRPSPRPPGLNDEPSKRLRELPRMLECQRSPPTSHCTSSYCGTSGPSAGSTINNSKCASVNSYSLYCNMQILASHSLIPSRVHDLVLRLTSSHRRCVADAISLVGWLKHVKLFFLFLFFFCAPSCANAQLESA